MPLIQESMAAYERGGTQKDEYSADEVVSVACPICDSCTGATLCVEHRSIGIKRCAECSVIYTSPRIREPAIVYWGDYDSYLAECRLIFSAGAPHHRDPNYLEELELIERYMPQRGRILDVGCNMGILLRHARSRGWTAVGCEPSPALHRIATQHGGLDVHNCFLDELPAHEDGTFDVVTLSDVLEHVTDPRPFLESVHRLLRSEGLMYVKVPNASWNLLKQRALALLGKTPNRGVWDSYEHVVHYTDQTLRRLLVAKGFEPLALTVARPVQVPVWHLRTGQYFQYPTPWVLDWRRHLGRSLFFRAAQLERLLRGGRIGPCAPNLVSVARKV